MSSFVLTQIDAAVELFVSLINHGGGTPRYRRNLQWLLKLRARASSRISATSAVRRSDSQQVVGQDRQRGSESGEDGEDVELLGWRTRLIERAGQDRQTIKTIPVTTGPADDYSAGVPDQSTDHRGAGGAQGLPRTTETTMSGMSIPLATPDSTNGLVRIAFAFQSPELKFCSYMTSGIQCSCKTYSGHPQISQP